MRLWLPIALAIGVVLGGCGDASVARLVGPSGEIRLEVTIERATTAEERMRGLVGHGPLSRDEGLLLVFPIEGEVCIVNEGVTFGIDAVYADDAGRVSVIERAIPAGDTTARCHPDTRRVLEVPGGAAAAAEPGDRLEIDP